MESMNKEMIKKTFSIRALLICKEFPTYLIN